MKIIKPTLIIDKNKCTNNITRMVNKAAKNDISLRPHFKTHQSAVIGKLFKDQGINSATVSSIDMAEYFINNGWKDLTLAFPINILEIDSINKLIEISNLNLLVENTEAVEFLNSNLRKSTGVFVKIDSGYNRTGIDSKNLILIKAVVEKINNSPHLDFKGFLTHSGQTYKAKTTRKIKNIHNNSVSLMIKLKKLFGNDIILSIGDTPSCSIAENFKGIDEIRPGYLI